MTGNTDFKIIAVTDPDLCAGDLPTRCRRILEGGADAVILRAKALDEDAYEVLLRRVLEKAGPYADRVIPHTFAETAARAGCRAVHLPLPVFRKLVEERLEIPGSFDRTGVSVHSPEEAARASEAGASYVTYGHVFETDCKKGLAPRGVPMLKKTVEAVTIPVYAIGGISEKNIAETRRAGASGACLMSRFMRTKDPAEYVRMLKEALKG